MIKIEEILANMNVFFLHSQVTNPQVRDVQVIKDWHLKPDTQVPYLRYYGISCDFTHTLPIDNGWGTENVSKKYHIYFSFWSDGFSCSIKTNENGRSVPFLDIDHNQDLEETIDLALSMIKMVAVDNLNYYLSCRKCKAKGDKVKLRVPKDYLGKAILKEVECVHQKNCQRRVRRDKRKD